MGVPHVTLREIAPDIEAAVLALRVSPAQEQLVDGVARFSQAVGFVPTGEVESHGEVHLALDLTQREPR